MEGEFKRAMKLMWGNKRMRKVFGCGFGLLGNGGVLLLTALLAAMPLLAYGFGKELSEKFMVLLLWMSAYSFLLLGGLISRTVFVCYGKLGRCFGSFPMAKCVLTKCYTVNTISFWSISFLVTLALHGVCVYTGAVASGRYAEIMVSYGIVFLLNAVFGGIRNKEVPEFDVYGVSIGSFLLLTLYNFFLWEDGTGTGASLETAGLVLVLCFTVGLLLLYFLSKKRYKERDTFVLILLDERK